MALSCNHDFCSDDCTGKQAAFLLSNCSVHYLERKKALRMFPAVMIASIWIYLLLNHKQTRTYTGQEIAGIAHGDQMLVTCAEEYVCFESKGVCVMVSGGQLNEAL